MFMTWGLWKYLHYDQKRTWDRVAYSHLRGLNPVVDVGCGEGRFISQDPAVIIGLDWNEQSLEECKRKGYNVVHGDVRTLPFDDGSVSGIHCSHVIEHFLPADVHKILSEFDRVLAPGGTVVVRAPLLWKHFYSDLTHVRPYNPQALIHYFMLSRERTLSQIATDYHVVSLRWRYALNRWGFPWVNKTGYMLVMRKSPHS
jgi:ubiquinone/menaquinone biosynthesis C-methylase UbiE